jgi:hypothetical protein
MLVVEEFFDRTHTGWISCNALVLFGFVDRFVFAAVDVSDVILFLFTFFPWAVVLAFPTCLLELPFRLSTCPTTLFPRDSGLYRRLPRTTAPSCPTDKCPPPLNANELILSNLILNPSSSVTEFLADRSDKLISSWIISPSSMPVFFLRRVEMIFVSPVLRTRRM